MSGLVVIFRTQSEVEASIVRGLLEAHDVPSIVSSSATASRFPVSVNEMGEVRISVHEDDAEEALRIIDSHRTALSTERVVRLRDEFDTLQRDIEYRFRDRGLLEHAMTHTSRANEDVSGGVRDNESLEFLGDAVLGFVIADMLFREFPAFDEGQKSKMKAALVSTTTLARQAERLAIGDHLLLGRGEERSGGRRKQALLADGYEALIAAIYLDGGVDHVRAFIAREFAPLIAELKGQTGASGEDAPERPDSDSGPRLLAQDYKSRLQETLQAQDHPLPEYRLLGTMGPDHEKIFRVAVLVRGDQIAEGTGSSKKDAEQDAARRTLEKLRTEN